MVIISSSDNGPGINQETRKKVLTPYYTTKEAGTGLGLPTVHRIISEMHGSLTIAASELGGAAIIIKL